MRYIFLILYGLFLAGCASSEKSEIDSSAIIINKDTPFEILTPKEARKKHAYPWPHESDPAVLKPHKEHQRIKKY